MLDGIWKWKMDSPSGVHPEYELSGRLSSSFKPVALPQKELKTGFWLCGYSRRVSSWISITICLSNSKENAVWNQVLNGFENQFITVGLDELVLVIKFPNINNFLGLYIHRERERESIKVVTFIKMILVLCIIYWPMINRAIRTHFFIIYIGLLCMGQ